MLKILFVDPRYRVQSPQLASFSDVTTVVTALVGLLLNPQSKGGGSNRTSESDGTTGVNDSTSYDVEFLRERGVPALKARSGDSVVIIQDSWRGRVAAGEILRIVRSHLSVDCQILRADPQLSLLAAARPSDGELVDFFEITGSMPVVLASNDLIPLQEPQEVDGHSRLLPTDIHESHRASRSTVTDQSTPDVDGADASDHDEEQVEDLPDD